MERGAPPYREVACVGRRTVTVAAADISKFQRNRWCIMVDDDATEASTVKLL